MFLKLSHVTDAMIGQGCHHVRDIIGVTNILQIEGVSSGVRYSLYVYQGLVWSYGIRSLDL